MVYIYIALQYFVADGDSEGVSVNCEKTEAAVFRTRYQGPEPQQSYTRGKNRWQEKQRSSKKTLVGRHQGLDGEATGGVYSYGQRQGSVENDGASVHGPRPSEMRRGLGKARHFDAVGWATGRAKTRCSNLQRFLLGRQPNLEYLSVKKSDSKTQITSSSYRIYAHIGSLFLW